VSLPDTPKNQRAYPQSRSQKPGCGFPLLKLVGLFSLSSGVLLDYVKGNKHQHEMSLWSQLLDQFKPGDLALADRGFCSYVFIALLWAGRVHSLLRLHQARSEDLRQGKRLGPRDRLVSWHNKRHSCLSPFSLSGGPQWVSTGWQALGLVRVKKPGAQV